ncbi:MAG: polyphosphate kinase 2 family protein [Propionibacteriaceae bacterium]|jgi:PPK2 family polyphosphate:nucleotide phosphotransferase|nr:polyphosphate kinase 2 family protein [Propionibacteriaceae bacterium]
MPKNKSHADAPASALSAPRAARPTAPLRDLLRYTPGTSPAGLDPAATPGYPGKGKRDAAKLTDQLAPALSEWQERLYAAAKGKASQRSVLVVLQGMDTSGKGGVARHVMGMVDPQGLRLVAFKQPTKEELSHHFLWRIRRGLPGPGLIGVFDRSHYEDVLVGRVDELVPQATWEKRYAEINRFEAEVAAAGTTIIKCYLHISRDEQRDRLLARLDDPAKYWKYSPGDVDVRLKWDAYATAYQAALDLCSTDVAPWYVIPANRKWYRNWAVATLLLEHLEALDPQWPPATFDVAEQVTRVLNS